MADVFLKIVNMSISASWLVFAVLAFRLIFKKAPKWIHVLLWSVVAVRLLCPFSIESALSLIPSAETISPEIMISQEPTIHTGVPAINSVVNPIITETFAPEPVASANPLQIWIPVLAMIWGIGVALLLAYTAISYWHLRRKVSTAILLRDNIFQSEAVSSPFVLGIIRAKIYLPFQMDGQNLEHVVSHEQAHIRRRDHWWKPLGFLLLTIHWFNPLMWLAYVLLCRDIELACDEKVVKELGRDQRADYSQALLACSVNRRMIAACPLAFGEVGVKERVKTVLNYKKPAFWVIAVSLIACAVVAVCFLTNPKNDDSDALPLLHLHSFGVVEVTYETQGPSFSMVAQQNPPVYAITDTMQLMSKGEHSADNEWTVLGSLEETVLTQENFDELFFSKGNWFGKESASTIRKNTANAWTLIYNQDVLYYVLQQKNGEVYLAYGYYDYSEKDDPASDDTNIQWLFKLAYDLHEDIGIVATSGENVIPVVVFPAETQIADIKDYVSWLDIAPGANDTVPFTILCDGREQSGLYSIYDAETFESLDFFRPSGLSPQAYLFQNAEYGHDYIVTMRYGIDGVDLYCFGARIAEKIQLDNETAQPKLEGTQKLTLEDVVKLSSKEYELTWSDFEGYYYYETGSGLYIRVYEINEMFQLWIGGSWTDEDPMYIWLTLADDLNTRIDIRDGGVEEFITKDHSETLLNRAIYDAIINCNRSEKTMGLNHCASFVMLDKEEISGTPVVGSTDHVGVVTVYGLALHHGYDLVDGELYVVEGSHTPVAITFDVLNGKYSLKEYWRPGDGIYYAPDIREKFPDHIEDEVMDTQKYYAAQNQECYVQAMRNNGVEVSGPNQQPLSAEELSWFNETFQPFVYDERGEPIGVNPWSCFFTSYYDDVRNLNFEEFMRYFPQSRSFTSDAEFEALKSLEVWPFDWVETREDMPVPISKYPASLVNMALKEYAGITTADLDTSGVAYLPEYDAYYNYTSDFGPGMFTCTRGEVIGDIVRLYEELETGTDMLTLRKVGNNYQIVAHQCIEGNNGAEAFYG